MAPIYPNCDVSHWFYKITRFFATEPSCLQARSEELEKHNETLKAELEKASQDKEDLKQMHNNYFLQVQTLINQKAIEAPGEKKKPFWKFW